MEILVQMAQNQILELTKDKSNMKYCFTISFFICIAYANAQTKDSSTYIPTNGNEAYRIMFYNAENFFDPFNDSLKNDEDFLPQGNHFWTWNKFQEKANNLFKVITAVGKWQPPMIVGFCEVENRFVLNQLIEKTPLARLNYGIVHHDSPDNRGIDVAMIYLKDQFTPIHDEAIHIVFPNDNAKKTRDILYVEGVTNKKDTLHLFINHWPSRLGGQLESDANRTFVASVLKNKVDSIFKANINANIIITGDFNDEPDNTSITETLKAKHDYENSQAGFLYNLSYYLKEKKGLGSHKFQGQWGMLDQIIVSGSLLNKQNNVYTSTDNAHVFNADFLLVKDEQNVGFQPNRTYVGFKYNGGFSDHLPVYLDLFNK